MVPQYENHSKNLTKCGRGVDEKGAGGRDADEKSAGGRDVDERGADERVRCLRD